MFCLLYFYLIFCVVFVCFLYYVLCCLLMLLLCCVCILCCRFCFYFGCFVLVVFCVFCVWLFFSFLFFCVVVVCVAVFLFFCFFDICCLFFCCMYHLFFCVCFWHFISYSFWFDQITTESDTAKCLCNRSANTDRWQLDNNDINVLVQHRCLAQALHSPDETHDVWETMTYTAQNSFLFRSVIPPDIGSNKCVPENC